MAGILLTRVGKANSLIERMSTGEGESIVHFELCSIR